MELHQTRFVGEMYVGYFSFLQIREDGRIWNEEDALVGLWWLTGQQPEGMPLQLPRPYRPIPPICWNISLRVKHLPCRAKPWFS